MEAKIPENYSIDVIADGDFHPSHLLGLLARRLGQMGRRYSEDILIHLADDRVQWAALNCSFKDAGNPWLMPPALLIGTQEAASFMQTNNITPAMPIDGASSFQFSVGRRFRSGSDNLRRVEGYGFTTDGEAVYIVFATDEGAMVIKRAWKAHREYKPAPPYDQLALVQRPPSIVGWGSLRPE